MSLLVISEILGLFPNTLTADDKLSFHNRENLLQAIQMLKCNYQRNKNNFVNFSQHL